ncbi:hypothetical protein PV411_38700 [Streptomyces sp. NRRL_B-16638]|uniref:Uncharacterized protein n=1 Tax=Streptomyces coelicolor (strain ATCC BAA-471 / A3(2) / M145) TaxID=100226 RepID=Q8VWD3_STRCO|nr:hypothetical protein [Streptomyces sp. NRRL_B-16638]MDX2930424.1 hypothetical protein [Streptomyces sp. NRRL_B-16638]CAD12012.1 hypothetical protein [Streptomyces coelicolor A3(2)]
MTAPSVAVQAPERADTRPAPPASLEDRLTAVSALMDDRLTVAALAVAVNAAVSVPDVGPVDLADVVRVPADVQPYRPPVDLYPTPVAAVLQRARARLERDGWCQGATVDEDGARCLYGALHAEAASTGELHDALAVLLDAIRRHFPDEESVPAFNDGRHGSRVVFRVLDQAADLAHTRNL